MFYQLVSDYANLQAYPKVSLSKTRKILFKFSLFSLDSLTYSKQFYQIVHKCLKNFRKIFWQHFQHLLKNRQQCFLIFPTSISSKLFSQNQLLFYNFLWNFLKFSQNNFAFLPQLFARFFQKLTRKYYKISLKIQRLALNQ